jgi:hypothetical protein
MQKFIFVLFALMTAACGNQKAKGGIGAMPTNLKDTTDRKACSGAADPNASLFSNSWHLQQEADSFLLSTTYSFDSSSLTLTNTCSWSTGVTLTVNVEVPVIYSAKGSLMVRMANSNTVTQSVSGFSYSCTVKQDVKTMTYRFAGRCLSLNNGAKSATLTP